MKTTNDNTSQYDRHRRWLAIASLSIFILILALLTILCFHVLSPYLSSPDELQQFLESFGWKGRFILLGLQCVQVFIALIPGEVIELGAGYAYGALQGMLICLIGVSLSSLLILLLTKKFGAPMAELFISREKLNQLTFLHNESKLNSLIFWLFFIPGTPKDVLTYFVGLTKIKPMQFLSISLIARIPSILSSTVCGQMLGAKNYLTAGIVFGATSIISLLGYLLYNRFVKSKKDTNEVS